MPRPRRTPPLPARLAAALVALPLACADGEGGASATEGPDSAAATTDASASATSATTTGGGPGTAGASASTSTGATSATAASAGETDDASTGAAPGCEALPLCDDFEGAAVGGPPDPGRWAVVSPNCMGSGALAIDDAEAHSGGRSLRVDGGGGYCDHVFIAHEAAIQGLGDELWGRFYLRLQAPLGQGHVTFLTMRDAADAGGKDLRMGGQSEVLMWNRESDDATLPVLSPAGIALSTAPPAATWLCVEFRVSAAGELETWLDGQAIAGLQVDAEPTPEVDQQWHQKPDWAPQLVDLKLGWESYAGQTMTLWIDDVAVAAAPIGCG